MRRGAQRAIEEQRTPPRYAEVIRRYFERLPDAVERATPGAAPDAPDTKTTGDRSPGGRG